MLANDLPAKIFNTHLKAATARRALLYEVRFGHDSAPPVTALTSLCSEPLHDSGIALNWQLKLRESVAVSEWNSERYYPRARDL
jgi:hypothetical protein